MTVVRALHLRNSDRVSGPERLILQQFQRASPDVDAALAVFVTGGKTNPFLEVAKDAGMRAVAIGQRSSYDRKVKRALLAACKDLDPHVLVTHDYKANLIGRPIARMLGIACVAVVHGYTAESLRVRAFEHLDRRALKRFDAVVAVSDVMETRLLKAGVPRERLHRIENTIDADSITMAALAARDEARRTWAPSEERLIVTLGRLSPEKGLRDLLQALADVSFPRWRWLVVGDGPQEAQLREDAKRAGIADRVRFAGWVVDSSAALGAADVFAMPSHTEGLPLALLEAMAVGLPIVATRVGGMPKALAERLLRDDELFLSFLRTDEGELAAYYGFRFGNKLYHFQSGMAPVDRGTSPGTILRNHTLAHDVFGRGLSEFDFLDGDESYKFQWATGQRRLFDITLRPRTVRGAAGHVASILKGLVKFEARRLRAEAD